MNQILLVIAIVCFALSAFGVDLGDVSLIALGLAFFAGSFLAPAGTIGRRGR